MSEVTQAYQDLFGRTGDTAGINYWTASGLTGADLTTAMVNSAKNEYGFSYDFDQGVYVPPAEPDEEEDLFQPDKVPTTSSYSGLPEWFSSDLLTKLLPELTNSFTDLPGQIDEWTEKNLASSASASKNLLDGHMTNLLADLSKRGMLGGEGSSVASDAMANLGTQVAKNQTVTDLATTAAGAAQKFQVPGVLGQLAGLGTSSTSQSSDPLAPYQLYSNMLLGMM